MRKSTKHEWLKGKNMTCTNFGKRGCCHGWPDGGYDTYMYGIKGIFGLYIRKSWGVFTE